MATKPKTTSTAVVSVAEQLKNQLATMKERTAPASGISIKVTQDKYFLMPDGVKTQGPIQVVILDFTSKNMFYPDAFDAKNITPPACFSIGDVIAKMAPSKNSPDAQAQDCASCTMNQFGSAGVGKACKNSRALAVIAPDSVDGPIWILNTSPTANKGFDGMVTYIARSLDAPPIGAVVTVGFDENETYAKLVFSDAVPNPNVGKHLARQAEARALLEVEPDVSTYVAKPAPTSRGKIKR